MRTARLFFPALFAALLWLAVACRQATLPTPTPDSSPKPVAVPTEVVGAQAAVVEFMRVGAISAVPARNATWRDKPVSVPTGFSAHQFVSADVTMVVTWKAQGPEAYHVSLHNATSGYCWQAIVNPQGQIVRTGLEAETAAAPGNAAADFCVDQGYDYVIREGDDGSPCSYCVFPDGSECKSWPYFYGDCAPGTP